MAENVTCTCSDHFNQLLVTGTRGCNGGQCKQGDISENTLEYYSQIHQKCDSGGNWERLQCNSGICFCVDPKTGKPTPDKAALYGALQSLACCKLSILIKINVTLFMDIIKLSYPK